MGLLEYVGAYFLITISLAIGLSTALRALDVR